MNEVKNNLVLDEWKIVEDKFILEDNLKNETLFSVGNGYLGMRGNFEEGLYDNKFTAEGTYINGFYETYRIEYGEKAYSFPETGQTMVNVINAKIIKIFADDEEFNMLKSNVPDYKRILDFKEGVLKRNIIWETKKGKKLILQFERLTSFLEKHLAAVHVSIKSIDFEGKIKIFSILDGETKNIVSDDDPRKASGISEKALIIKNKEINKDTLEILAETKNSGFEVFCAAKNSINAKSSYNIYSYNNENEIGLVYETDIKMNEDITFNKYICYITSKDYKKDEIKSKKNEILNSAFEKGFEKLKKEQAEYLNDFWYQSDVEIEGDLYLQQGIRFNMFHLLQSAGRDGKTNTGAKGLTGQGYEGHYFWDTEMYIVPFFTYTKPNLARKLLEYRYYTLDKARERARQMSHKKGALFPWRTINGEECSAYFPASTAQYHINSDIAYAVRKYVESTGDIDFLKKYGAEILFETARIFADLGHYVDGKGFCIDGVTGPDEYTAIVNNNAYTNLMAKEHLKYAYNTAVSLKQNYYEEFIRIADKIGLDENEILEWKKASDNMYIPYDDKLKIYPQDDTFLNKKIWDFENTPKDKYPLLLNFHPLVIYRHQVCKQADWVLALFLHSEKFDINQKRRDFNYYEKITTHDSSLSPCIFSIVACDIGYTDKAYEYFMKTARMDLNDTQGNTRDGIHCANMAGSWMGIVFGFGGFRVLDEKISFNPSIPLNWKKYSFKISLRGRLIKVSVDRKNITFNLLLGDDIKISCFNKDLLLKSGKMETVSMMK